MRGLRRQSISVSLPPEATSSGAHRIVTIRASRVDRGENEQSFTVITGMGYGDCGFDFRSLTYLRPRPKMCAEWPIPTHSLGNHHTLSHRGKAWRRRYGCCLQGRGATCLRQNFLPRSVTSRPLKGDTPTVDLVLGYKKSNQSPILKLLLSRLDELVARVSKKAH